MATSLLSKAQSILALRRQQALGCFTESFYNSLEVKQVNPEAQPPTLKLTFKSGEGFRNSLHTLHGGAIASVLDLASLMAVQTYMKKDGLIAVCTHMNVDYLATGKLDTDLEIEVSVLKSGKFLSFSRAILYSETGLPIAQSSVVSKNLASMGEDY